MMSTQVYELHVFEGLRPMRAQDRCWPHWPWPAEGSEYEELCRVVLAEQMRQETPRAVLLGPQRQGLRPLAIGLGEEVFTN